MKKIVVLGITLIVIFSLLAVYLFVFGGEQRAAELWKKFGFARSPAPDGGVAVENKAVAISARKIVSPALSFSQDRIYYFDGYGQLYRSDLEGKGEETLGLTNIQPIQSVFWPDQDSNFITKGKTAGYDGDFFRLYLAKTSVFRDLALNVESVSWLPGGGRYFYVWRRGEGGRELKIAEAETNQYSKVADLAQPFVIQASPNGNFVLLREPPSADAVNKVFRLDLSDGKITPLLDRGKNLEALFSPDGEKLLFTRVSQQSGLPELWLHDFKGKTFKNLGTATSALKAVWSKDSSRFYFALPAQISAGDPEISGKTEDALYVYDLGSNEKKKIEFTSGPVDFRDLIVNNDGSVFFFRNGWDDRLYRLDLK